MMEYPSERLTYQIRHREYGIFQGETMGFCFWHPLSDLPELGFCEYPTYEQARQFILLVCSDIGAYQQNYFDFAIEIFDREQSERIIRNALCPV